MNVKQAISAFILFCSIPVAGQSGTWNLDRTVSKAVETSNGIRINRLATESAKLDAENAEKGWYPSLSLSAGANIVSEVMEISLPFNKSIRFGDYDSYDLKIGFNQIIYDGGRLRSLRDVHRALGQMSGYKAESMKLAAEYRAKSVFFRVVMAEKAVETSKLSIHEAENHLETVQARFEQGMVLENDLLRSKLRVSRARMELTERSTDLATAKALFREVIGIDQNEEIEVVWTDGGSAELRNPSIETALRSRPELKAYDAAMISAERSAESARAGLKPRIGLFGAFHYGKPGLDLPANEWMHYFAGGVMLNWNVWDWGITSRNVEKALISRKKIMKERNDFEKRLARELSEALASYNAAKERVKLSSEAAEYAENTLKLINASYREGLATETDYDNAYTAYTRAMYEKSMAVVAVKLAEARVEYIMGIPYSGGEK